VSDLDEHFALAGRFDVDFDDLQRLTRLKRNSGT
jgi:hypothetical protein